MDSSSSAAPPPPHPVFYFDTTILVWVLVVCTRLFKVFPSLTILSFSSMVYGREYYGNMY